MSFLISIQTANLWIYSKLSHVPKLVNCEKNRAGVF